MRYEYEYESQYLKPPSKRVMLIGQLNVVYKVYAWEPVCAKYMHGSQGVQGVCEPVPRRAVSMLRDRSIFTTASSAPTLAASDLRSKLDARFFRPRAATR